MCVLRIQDDVRSEAPEVANGMVEGRIEVSILNGDDNRAAKFVCDAMSTTVIDKMHLLNGKGNGKDN